ncbi:MAG: hypothetical protein PHT26_16055 [Lentimicrobiaceae bacterium]|nr:hypothetical protein [Lentimicrobiaceae bacterium]
MRRIVTVSGFLILICLSCNYKGGNNSYINISPTGNNDTIGKFNNYDSLNLDNGLLDEQLVNKATDLQKEAGMPISHDDTLKLEKALALLDEAMNVNSRNDVALANKVKLLTMLGRFSEALDGLEILIESKANYAEGYAYSGFIYEKIGKNDSSQIMYHKAILAYDNRISNYGKLNDEINRAFLFFFVSSPEIARNQLTKIITKYPNDKSLKNIEYSFENFNREKFIEDALY